MRGGGRADGGGRKIEERTLVRENPRAKRDLIAQVEDGKWVATGQGKADTGSREELLGLPRTGGTRRRAMESDRRGCHPGGWSLRTWERWGGEAGEIEREVASTGDIWRTIWNRSREREKRNELSRKNR